MALRPPLRGAKPSRPPHYYEGFLEKKGPQDKGYKKYWTGLRGLMLYFYNTSRDVQYVEKINLDNFVSLTDSYLRSFPQASDEGVGLSLKLRGQEVKLKAESLEARELWKGFIITMVEMQVPSNLMLLPGHIYMMSEALSKEQERRAQLSQRRTTSSLHYELVEEEMPACYFKVSRTEAQVLLDRNPDCGNLLLRPGGDGKSISVTTRQMLNGTPVVKHYRVSRVGQQYVIDIEQPHHCSSLADVVEYFVSNTKKTLVPLSLDEDYAEKLEFVETNKENGESVWEASMPPCPKPPKAGAKVEAMIPPTSRQSPLSKPLPTPPAFEEDEEQTYVNDEDVAAITGTKPKPACLGAVKVIWERDGQTKAQPVPTGKPAAKGQCMKTSNSALILRQHGGSSSCQATSWVGDLPADISEELARKLRERRANLEN
ncbi:signal-transducing adaptor protein 2 isoform X2 [Dermochelys coriacea]|uniref:signal-transducing adaptor protein 2 isoform X2 n=1 Tax=Dermochelys coriacea TaxID=27794 RepID=UPI0018E7804F|nr:signal-transducing adaptor protein 2 isoform X2 [Dermochelys coriacea]